MCLIGNISILFTCANVILRNYIEKFFQQIYNNKLLYRQQPEDNCSHNIELYTQMHRVGVSVPKENIDHTLKAKKRPTLSRA